MKKNYFTIFSAIIYTIALVILTVITVPLIQSYDNPKQFKAFIDGYGFWGYGIMMFVQVAQVIVALIPGEFVEFVSGTLYGTFGGLIFCMIGVAIGQAAIFFSVKFFGRSLVEKAAGSKTMNRFKFLSSERKLRTIIFILYFVPGTPKDLITYIVPMTKIKFLDFMIISLFARIPSILSSTMAGGAYYDNNLLAVIIVYGIIGIITLSGMLFYRRWESKHIEQISQKKDG